MEYAIVKNNVVINVIEADETFAEIYAAERNAEVILNDGKMGFAYVNGDIKDGKFRNAKPEISYPTKGKITWDNENWVWKLPDRIKDETSDSA